MLLAACDGQLKTKGECARIIRIRCGREALQSQAYVSESLVRFLTFSGIQNESFWLDLSSYEGKEGCCPVYKMKVCDFCHCSGSCFDCCHSVKKRMWKGSLLKQRNVTRKVLLNRVVSSLKSRKTAALWLACAKDQILKSKFKPSPFHNELSRYWKLVFRTYSIKAVAFNPKSWIKVP